MPTCNQILEYASTHFSVFFALAWCWIFAVAGVSAVRRKAKGRPIFAEVPKQALFVEQWASGRSLRSFLTRLGGARNCLFVAVTKDKLIVHPHFPFSLLFLPETYGLDWEIPKSALGEARLIAGRFTKLILIECKQGDGSTSQLELKLRAPEAFEKAIAEMRKS